MKTSPATNGTKTNDLRHTIDVNNSKVNAQVKIRLNDECNNGHQDFSITGSFWEIGEPRIDRCSITMGACHEEILKHFPELQIFVNLHLADYQGIPMYAVENGFFHLTDGFTDTKPNSLKFKAQFCKYYRVTPAQFDVLITCENKLRYAIALEKLGILTQWNAEAKQAIKLLEAMTGNTFVADSKKSQYHAPTEEQRAEEEQKEGNGYYSPEQIEIRKTEAIQAAKDKIAAGLLKDRNSDIKKANDEYNVLMAVHTAGMSLKNFIYYSHTNEGCFNWNTSSFNPAVTKEEFKAFLKVVDYTNLPEGFTFKLGKK